MSPYVSALPKRVLAPTFFFFFYLIFVLRLLDLKHSQLLNVNFIKSQYKYKFVILYMYNVAIPKLAFTLILNDRFEDLVLNF